MIYRFLTPFQFPPSPSRSRFGGARQGGNVLLLPLGEVPPDSYREALGREGGYYLNQIDNCSDL